MSTNIYMIGGAIGGVGKSLVSLSLIDYLTEIGQPPLLIESDTAHLTSGDLTKICAPQS